MERALARVCREAGARVATNMLLRDMNVFVARHDDRRLEVVANGLPLWGGAQVAVDTTLVSPVRGDGRPQPRAAWDAGACLRRAERRKATTNPELGASRRCRLQVVALEVGGRWSPGACKFLRLLAKSKARGVPEAVRKAAQVAFLARWSGMVAVAAARAFAASLLHFPPLPLAATAPSRSIGV